MILTALTNFLHRHISTTQYFVDTGILIHKSGFFQKDTVFPEYGVVSYHYENNCDTVIKHFVSYLTNGLNGQECLSHESLSSLV